MVPDRSTRCLAGVRDRIEPRPYCRVPKQRLHPGEKFAFALPGEAEVVAKFIAQLPLMHAVHARSGGPDLGHCAFGCQAASRQSQDEEYTPQVRLADEDSDEGKEAAERPKCERLPPFTAGIC